MIWLFICLVRSSRLWRTKVYQWRTGATNEILRSTNDGPRSVDEVFLILLLNGAFSFSTLFIIIVIFPPYFFTISTPPWLLLEQLQAHNPSPLHHHISSTPPSTTISDHYTLESQKNACDINYHLRESSIGNCPALFYLSPQFCINIACCATLTDWSKLNPNLKDILIDVFNRMAIFNNAYTSLCLVRIFLVIEYKVSDDLQNKYLNYPLFLDSNHVTEVSSTSDKLPLIPYSCLTLHTCTRHRPFFRVKSTGP